MFLGTNPEVRKRAQYRSLHVSGSPANRIRDALVQYPIGAGVPVSAQ